MIKFGIALAVVGGFTLLVAAGVNALGEHAWVDGQR